MVIDVPKIIGLPPGNKSNLDTPMTNSMPQAMIIPCEPKLSLSEAAFTVTGAMGKFSKLVTSLGYNYPNTRGVEVAFIADNFPADNFTNEYGDTFLEKINDIGGGGIGQLAQMTGETNSLNIVKAISTATGEASGFTGISGMVNKGADSVKTFADNLANSNSKIKQILGTTITSALSGGRIDFPQVWKGSGYSPSYTMTIRLYNPDPSSKTSTDKYIVGPLAVLLTLALPRIQNTSGGIKGFLYNWPFFSKLFCPGMYFLNPCCVTSVSVIKGGDQQSIAWNQRLNIVDVRLEFTSLFNTMVVGEGQSGNEPRPTLKGYLNALLEQKDLDQMPIGQTDEGKSLTESIAGDIRDHARPSSPVPRSDGIGIPKIRSRAAAYANIAIGELNKNTNQAKAFLHYAKGIYNSAMDTVESFKDGDTLNGITSGSNLVSAMTPSERITEMVNKTSNYTQKYKNALQISGNVAKIDKDNISGSLTKLEESIDEFAQMTDFSDQYNQSTNILGESIHLRNTTNDAVSVELMSA